MVEGILWPTAKMMSVASWCALAKISSASFLAYSWRSAARWSRRRHLSVA
jgi:hypothetical protein